MARHRYNTTLLERFMEKVEVRSGDECWPWTGALRGKNRDRAAMDLNGIGVNAARVAWFLGHGVWPEGIVCHHCDNPKCVRPSHLFSGTHTDNRRDAIRKGRQVGFTEEQKKFIVENSNSMSQTQIAAKLGCAQSSVSKFLYRRRKNADRQATVD